MELAQTQASTPAASTGDLLGWALAFVSMLIAIAALAIVGRWTPANGRGAIALGGALAAGNVMLVVIALALGLGSSPLPRPELPQGKFPFAIFTSMTFLLLSLSGSIAIGVFALVRWRRAW